MGSIGDKMDISTAKEELVRFKDIIVPIHCQLGIDNISLSGSLRRGKLSDIGDIDLVLTTLDGKIPNNLSEILSNNGYRIDSSGSSLIRAISVESNIQIDIYSCTDYQFPMMMVYLTGPRDFNIQMRSVAKRKGLKLNQLSLTKDGQEVDVKSEIHLFNILGCNYIEPRHRVNFYDCLSSNKYKKIRSN